MPKKSRGTSFTGLTSEPAYDSFLKIQVPEHQEGVASFPPVIDSNDMQHPKGQQTLFDNLGQLKLELKND